MGVDNKKDKIFAVILLGNKPSKCDLTLAFISTDEKGCQIPSVNAENESIP